MTSKVWFVTGSSSGLGKSVVEHVLKRGDRVVATLRKPEALHNLKNQYPSSQLLILKLDVAQPTEIIEAFAAAIHTFGRIDIVYNNAGYVVGGEVESFSDDAARAIWDVDYWGAVNVSKEAVRVFRDVNKPTGGRLLNAGSMGGITSIPGVTHYCATKFALKGFTEGLSKELDADWNIKISIIEFGGFKTRATDTITLTPPHPAYTKPEHVMAQTREICKARLNVTGDADKAAEKLYQLAALEDPPLRLVLGKDAIACARAKLEELKSEVDKYESWSENLEMNVVN